MARLQTSKYERFVADGGLANVRIMRMNGMKNYEIADALGITNRPFISGCMTIVNSRTL